ncbi:MAG: hypothetical protein WBQ56_20835 [Candidatus Sulfotelmatobacter sp.]
MNQRRASRLRPAITPLTPALPEPTTTLTTGHKLAALHRTLESERKANARMLRVLGRYIELLEHVIASQRQAFEELDKPLIPQQSKRKN